MQRQLASMRVAQGLWIEVQRLSTWPLWELLGRVPRCLSTVAVLLVPASMVVAISCGLNCGTRCEPAPKGPVCYTLPASTCVDGGAAYPCAVRVGCHCADMSSSNSQSSGCNVYSCSLASDEASCLAKPGCEWGDTCQDAIDCHIFDTDESGCSANWRQCAWHKDCG